MSDISGHSRLVVIATVISAVATVFMAIISLPEAYIHSISALHLNKPEKPNSGKEVIATKSQNKFSPSFDKKGRVYVLKVEPRFYRIQFYAAYNSNEANTAIKKIKLANQDIQEIKDLYITQNFVTNKGIMYQIRLNFSNRDLANRFCDRFYFEKRGDCFLVKS